MIETAPPSRAQAPDPQHPVAGKQPPSATAAPRLQIDALHAGYGRSEILHGIDLRLAVGESICLIGPNGAGKSTVLNAVFGMADIHRGRIVVDGVELDRRCGPADRLRRAGIAYVLQASSIFPGMSVEQNLRLGAYLMPSGVQAKRAVEQILQRFPKLAARHAERAGSLSGGERRQLEIARSLMMQPRLLLIDEPSIGLEPRAVEQVFAMLHGLQAVDGLSILMVEQNVRQGLAFADTGCVMVAGQIVTTGPGRRLLDDESVGKAFLGR